MKLRQALKIFDGIGEPYELKWKIGTREKALRRFNKIKTAKETDDYFVQLMDVLGVEGRAYIIRKSMPAEAFRLLMGEKDVLGDINIPMEVS